MISAIDLEAIDTSYYVEPTATSDVIDYKDPCKAGKISNAIYLVYVDLKHATKCFCVSGSLWSVKEMHLEMTAGNRVLKGIRIFYISLFFTYCHRLADSRVEHNILLT